MLNRNRFGLSFFIVLFSLFVWIKILSDPNSGVFASLAWLSLGHGMIQLIRSNSKPNIIETIIRTLYFVRNIVTPLLMSLSDYTTPFISVTSLVLVEQSVLIFLIETLIVYIYIYKTPVNKAQSNFYQRRLNSSLLFKIYFIVFLFITIALYILVPQSHNTFTNIFNETAAVRIAIQNDDVGITGSIDRIMYNLFGILFNFYRLMLPVMLLAWVKGQFKKSSIAISISIAIIATQIFFINDKTMTTLINIFVLVLYLNWMYPQKRILIVYISSSLSLIIFALLFVGKALQGSDFETNVIDYKVISFMLQAYIPGISNMYGVFSLPEWNVNILLSDLYSMIPFRNTIFGFDFGENTLEFFRANNDAGGQIIPLIGQAYYHFGLFSPFISVTLVRISMICYTKSLTTQNYVRYIYYIFVSVFAAMTPCLYYFGVFGSTFLTSMLLIHISSKLVKKTKMEIKTTLIN